MKSIFIFLIFISVAAASQNKTVTLAEQKINTFTCTYVKSIDLTKSDTSYYVYLLFQNQEYQHIVDSKMILFMNQTGLSGFIQDLDSAIAFNEKADMEWNTGGGYVISKYSGKDYIVLTENRTKGWTYTSKKIAQKLSDWFKTIMIGNE